MTRKECWGSKEDHSDKCDFYDSEGFCHKYGTWEKNGVTYGGDDVETITYCTHRTIKGKRINNAMNPLIMDRLCRWNEVMFNGVVKMIHQSFYNPDGIYVDPDGSMYDPVSKVKILPDGTVVRP